MKKILVATDGSEPAQAAVGWSAGFVEAMHAKAVVATVIEPAESELGSAGQRRAIAHRLEQEWTGPLRTRGLDHESVVGEGDPRTGLLEMASTGDIDTVVVGTRGAGGFAGLGVGSVPHYLARHLPCPLIAVPGPGGPLAGGTVVVGVDGSPANANAVRWAVSTAEVLGGELVAVFVHSPLADVMTHTAANWQYPGEEAVRQELALAGAADPRLERVAGNPVEELNRIAAEEHAWLVVVGRRGRGGVHGLVLGRVPAQVLHHTVGPVVVVPH
jgi:nucleotide-binding universal stress UspA family protein